MAQISETFGQRQTCLQNCSGLSHFCSECHDPKLPLEACRVDASHFYKSVSPDDARQAVLCLLARVWVLPSGLLGSSQVSFSGRRVGFCCREEALLWYVHANTIKFQKFPQSTAIYRIFKKSRSSKKINNIYNLWRINKKYNNKMKICETKNYVPAKSLEGAMKLKITTYLPLVVAGMFVVVLGL